VTPSSLRHAWCINSAPGGENGVQSKADLQIRSIVEMAELMLVISEQGLSSCEDDGCLLLNGMVRECAYRLRDAAELERKAHMGQESRDVGQE
jgi:hypothetical protein